MTKPDVIVVHPFDLDFCFWRYQMKQNRHLFNKIIVCLHGPSYKKGLGHSLTNSLRDFDCTVLPCPPIYGDWRNTCVNLCLQYSDSDTVLFLEPDLVFKTDKFLEKLLGTGDRLVGEKEGGEEHNRIHPFCILVTKDVLNKTSKNFAHNAPEYDHFGLFSREAQQIVPYTSLKSLGLIEHVDYRHLAGLSHNYSGVIERDGPNYNIPEFVAYNKMILDLNIPIVPEFRWVIEKSANVKV